MSKPARSSGKRNMKKPQESQDTQVQQKQSLASASTDSVSTLEWVSPQPGASSHLSEMENLDFESLEGLDDLIASLRKARGEQGEPWNSRGLDDDDDDEEEDAFGDLEYDDDSDEVDAELQLVPVTPDSNRIVPTNDAKPYKQPITTTSKALVPVQEKEDDDEDVDSEEERNILKEIRQEIVDRVRGEMKSEIEVYRAKMAAIENGRLPETERSRASSVEEPMDPEIEAALIKMKKLDKILKKRVLREKEVKRERILLERRIRDEIMNLTPVGRESRDLKSNTSKFLALTVPPRHNEGVAMDEEPPVDPFFKTQIDHEVLKEKTRKDRKNQGAAAGAFGGSDADTVTEDGSVAGASATSQGGSTQRSSTQGKKGRKRGKDFIKRNIELASKAADAIAMTDEEKHRLNALLSDLDSLPDVPDDNTNYSAEHNPYEVCVKKGEGFMPDEPQQASLSRIDSRLRELASTEDFASIASTPTEPVPEHKLFTRVMIRSDIDFERYGERALIETKEEREMHDRLRNIEMALARFHNSDELELETPDPVPLSEDQMRELVDQCVLSLSRAQSVTNSNTHRSDDGDEELSSRMSLLENPPRLSQETLQKLLSEAHFPLSRKLDALREQEGEPGGEDGELGGGAIQAETWKAIAEASAEDDGALSDSAQPRPSPHPSQYSSQHPSQHSSQHPSQQYHRQLSRSSLLSSGEPEFSQQRFSMSDVSVSEQEDLWEGERLRLPEINRSPYLVAQGLNNQPRTDARDLSGSRDWQSAQDSTPIDMIRNDLSDAQGRLSDSEWSPFSSGAVSEDRTPVPRPPLSRERRVGSGQSSASSWTTATSSRPGT